MNYLYVGIGGMCGALSRYLLSKLVSEITSPGFPYGTLSVNLIGSFLLSFIAYASLLKWNLPRKYLLVITTGFIGSFTTFSTFSVETLQLITGAKYFLAFTYVLISLIGGLSLSWLGIYLASATYPQEKESRPAGD